ncbi:glycine cleavage system aminomethyltransferase GcvT [Paenibacillus sp. N3/727]|uniref:glycine cleavage system aminomethyltransferase GcvT n=1 Tax=Paenibacillus sp. N3/727 TaxID=2925845 RepID=UPI001F53437A|nr:glycine cleavage system aminomethyltransferase GcvT [Paenibacillus sp. N3/727]UNK16345.1 glycine cleavage system aminomethyltransferase GcvT [Paenibacillus sp. N3/727]
MSSLQRTPLYPLYSDFPSVRCIDFGGWELPVQFHGIVREHEAVRRQAGLFDVSHMGEFLVTGPNAEVFLQQMVTNDVSRLSVGQAQYAPMCNDNGGTVDDLLVYKLSDNQFMLVVNASNIDKDLQWLKDHIIEGVDLQNISAETALIALQGPEAAAILSKVSDEPVHTLPSFHFIQNADVCGTSVLLSRTGYTGEDGFEIYCPAESASVIWKELLAAGEPNGLIPAGLGARDTLRFEAKLALYGQELSDTISPLEAGLGYFVKLDKGNFIGRDALALQKNEGVQRKLVGVELIDRGIPRSHYPVYVDNSLIGEITSGTQSPTSKRNLGLALIDSRFAAVGTEVSIEIRGKRLKAVVVKTPFYKKGETL